MRVSTIYLAFIYLVQVRQHYPYLAPPLSPPTYTPVHTVVHTIIILLFITTSFLPACGTPFPSPSHLAPPLTPSSTCTGSPESLTCPVIFIHTMPLDFHHPRVFFSIQGRGGVSPSATGPPNQFSAYIKRREETAAGRKRGGEGRRE